MSKEKNIDFSIFANAMLEANKSDDDFVVLDRVVRYVEQYDIMANMKTELFDPFLKLKMDLWKQRTIWL